MNSILPLWVLHFTLFLIKCLTCVLAKFGTYQSKPIAPCLLTYSLMTMSSFLCSSTVGFMVGSNEICPAVGIAPWTPS